jgi:hypothetical protein
MIEMRVDGGACPVRNKPGGYEDRPAKKTVLIFTSDNGGVTYNRKTSTEKACCHS